MVHRLTSVLLLLAHLVCYPQDATHGTGHIQVQCDAGAQVFLNDLFKGVSTEQMGGYIIMDVPVGDHRLKVVKPGKGVQEAAVTVEIGGVTLHTFEPFDPGAGKKETAPEKEISEKGRLAISSTYIKTQIKIPQASIDMTLEHKDDKIEPYICDLDPGIYTVELDVEGLFRAKSVRVVRVFPGQLTMVMRASSITNVSYMYDFYATEAHGGIKIEDLSMMLRAIPAGSATIGSPEGETGRMANFEDQRTAEMPNMWMSESEITREQYAKVMEIEDDGSSYDPMTDVSYGDALKFCKKLTGLLLKKDSGLVVRLPTEEEWEYACRAGTTTAYNWGDTFKVGYCNAENSYGGRARNHFDEHDLEDNAVHWVKSFFPNDWGLYDMHGNVAEWCLSPKREEQGVEFRMIRGGAWQSNASQIRSAFRGGYPPAGANNIGFRIVVAEDHDLNKDQ